MASTIPPEPPAIHGKKCEPVVGLTWNGAVQCAPRSGEVTRSRSVGCGVSWQVEPVSHAATNPTGSSFARTGSMTCTCPEPSTEIVPKILSALSPTFVAGSNRPCQARWLVQVSPPSVDVETHALSNGPICE